MSEFERSTIDVPPLDRLDADSLEAIHEASMYIVENVGIEIDHERARSIFADNGGHVDGRVVTLPRSIVETAIEAAPAEFTLHGRNPDHSAVVGGDGPPVRVPGYGASTVWTVEDGRRDARVSDFETLTKLAQIEEVITSAGYNVCVPTDLEADRRHCELLYRSLTLSDKPVMAPTYGERRARESLEMVSIAVDDPDLSKPYATGLVNTVPPRRIGAEMLEGLMTFAERGQPPIISSFAMTGASGPASLAGSMALVNAENLVGITLAQLCNPGTPVIYGVPASNVDPRHGALSIGSTASALFTAFAGQMGRYYGVPSRAGGGLTDSKRLDHQSGFESGLTQAITSFSGVDYVLHAAGTLDSYSVISPEKFLLDCASLEYLDRFHEGFRIDDDDLALDRIESVEPAGHFFDDEFAFDRPGGNADRPGAVLGDSRSYTDWANDGKQSAAQRGADRLERRLEAYTQPPMEDDIERELRGFLDRGLTRS